MFCRICFFLSSKKCPICKTIGTKHPKHLFYKEMKQMWDGLRSAQAVTTGDWRTDANLRWHFGEWMRNLTPIQHMVNQLLKSTYVGDRLVTSDNQILDKIRMLDAERRAQVHVELKLRGYKV